MEMHEWFSVTFDQQGIPKSCLKYYSLWSTVVDISMLINTTNSNNGLLVTTKQETKNSNLLHIFLYYRLALILTYIYNKSYNFLFLLCYIVMRYSPATELMLMQRGVLYSKYTERRGVRRVTRLVLVSSCWNEKKKS